MNLPTPTEHIRIKDGWRLFFYGKREVSGDVYDTEELWKIRCPYSESSSYWF